MIRLDSIPPGMIRTVLQATLSFDPAEKFQEGAILRGTVLRSIGDRSFLVRLGGLDLIGFSSQALKPGETITLRVDQLRPEFTVTLFRDNVGIDEKSASLLRLLLPAKQDLAGLLQRLISLFQRMPEGDLSRNSEQALKTVLEYMALKMFGKATPESIRSFLQNSGIFYESALARILSEGGGGRELKHLLQSDVKAQLLRLEADLEAEITRAESAGRSVPDGVKALLKEIRGFVQNIELNQLLNSLSKKEGGTFFFQIPFIEGQEVRSARIYIREEGSGKGKPKDAKSKSHSVTLMVELSSLGPVRADLTLSHRKVSGTVSFRSEEIRRLAEAELPSLVAALRDLGVEAEFSAAVKEMNFLTERLEDLPAEKERNIVNVTA
jgi:hypothetical protein